MAASMLRGTSETHCVGVRSSSAVSRDAADTRKPQDSNSFHRFAVVGGLRHAATADVALDRTLGEGRRQSTCQWSG